MQQRPEDPLSCRSGLTLWEQGVSCFLQGHPAAGLEVVPNQVTESGFGFVLTSFCCSLEVKHYKPDCAKWLQAGCGLPARSFVTMFLMQDPDRTPLEAVETMGPSQLLETGLTSAELRCWSL